MRTVDQGADAIGEERFGALPERVQEALGELAGAAREGLLALSVGVGPNSTCESIRRPLLTKEGGRGRPRYLVLVADGT